MKALVAVKRVVDFNVKIRVKSDGSGVELSNVKVVEEMVNLILAQRAYEVNSKAVQASDEMMQQTNNLKR